MAANRQHTTGTVTNGGTVAFPFNVLNGTRLLYLSVTSNTGQSISSITDTRSNTWTEAVDVTVGAFRFEIWTATGGSAGANTITANFSSFVSAPRMWLAEIVSIGALSDGATDTHDQTSAEDPMTLASLTAAGNGVAFVVAVTDSVHTFAQFLGHPFHDMSGGTNSRAGWGVVTNGESIAPTLDCSTTESGESLLMAFYDAGGGAAEHTSVFVG